MVTDRRTSDFNVLGVEGVGGQPLQGLVPYLATNLPEEAMPAVSQAVTILHTARQVRTSLQQVGVQPRAVRAFTDLGLTYPASIGPRPGGKFKQLLPIRVTGFAKNFAQLSVPERLFAPRLSMTAQEPLSYLGFRVTLL